MPDFGRSPRDSGEPSLDAIARADRFIDALAAEQPVASNDPGDLALASLLEGWRDDARRSPATGLVSEQEAAAAVRAGTVTRKRTHRGLTLVGSVAAALLCIGGFGAVVVGAHPGDAMYGLRTTLFGEPQSVRDDRVALAAQTELNQVQDMIARGDWEQAQDKLEAVSTAVQTVNDADRKQELIDEWNRLNVKVETRDPDATVPPSSPPNPEVVAPSSTSVTVPVPVLEPPTTTSTSESPSREPTSSQTTTTTSPTQAGLPPAPPTSVPSAPGSTTAPQASSTAPTTTTTAPQASSTAPTTTTTAPQTSSTAPTTSNAPAPALLPPSSEVTTTTAKVTATATTSTAAAPPTSESRSSSAPAAGESSSAQLAPDVTTTTTAPQPVIQLPASGVS